MIAYRNSLFFIFLMNNGLNTQTYRVYRNSLYRAFLEFMLRSTLIAESTSIYKLLYDKRLSNKILIKLFI